jgi:hypothetical protein
MILNVIFLTIIVIFLGLIYLEEKDLDKSMDDFEEVLKEIKKKKTKTLNNVIPINKKRGKK